MLFSLDINNLLESLFNFLDSISILTAAIMLFQFSLLQLFYFNSGACGSGAVYGQCCQPFHTGLNKIPSFSISLTVPLGFFTLFLLSVFHLICSVFSLFMFFRHSIIFYFMLFLLYRFTDLPISVDNQSDIYPCSLVSEKL